MNRHKLPNRRPSDLLDINHRGQPYAASIGYFDDGTPAEIFLDPPKRSNDMENLARDAALLISIALQHRIPIEEMRQSVGRNDDGVPHSVVGAALDALAAHAREAS